MGNIKLLTPELSSQIAAGEVVERPASIVKELIENSLDAQAKNIKITLEDGGLSRIQVEDDGVGMDEDDLNLSVLRHATSKIHELEDLTRIASFGFRGEALSAINSVSKFTIETRQRTLPTGFQLSLDTGQPIIKPVGRSVGTKVIVKDLFFNTPARKKFMKSARTEQQKIYEIINRLALKNPTVAFTLVHNQKPLLSYLAHDAQTRLNDVLGAELAGRLLPLTSKHPFINLVGYVGKPELAGNSSINQYLYVNARSVRDAYLAHAVKSSYGTLIMPRSHVPFVLDLNLPTELVDVNVHPRKEEVAFTNKSLIYEVVRSTVSQALSEITPTYSLPQTFVQHSATFSPNRVLKREPFQNTYNHQPAFLPETLNVFRSKEFESSEILQIAKTYLIKSEDEGFTIVDQHAAHERINYEKLLAKHATDQEDISPLLIPLALELTPLQLSLLEDNSEILQKAGITYSKTPVGISIESIPHSLKGRDLKAVVYGFIDDLQGNNPDLVIDDQSERALVYLSCRMSVKGGDFLTASERSALLNELENCKLPYTCPHGRPVSIKVSGKDLQVMFKRLV